MPLECNVGNAPCISYRSISHTYYNILPLIQFLYIVNTLQHHYVINKVLYIALLKKPEMLLKHCKFPCPFYVTWVTTAYSCIFLKWL